MVQAGIGGLDTPRTNLGDATYLSHQQLDFDISQEQSFQSPSKDNNNLVQQLQNGRRGALRTPRSRVALADRRNVPGGLGGGEFTPLLKSATRNSALRNGKENIQTPGFLRPGGLDNIPEDLSPLPLMHNSSAFGDSRNGSFMPGTPMPQMDTSSAASTPMALLPRRNEGPGVLQDGNQLSLREQENVIDKIEKENFGLKLKIHFLEEALRKAGPGFSEAALKENTELKVDKVTMQKELYRYRKTLTAAERDVELYRQQLIEMQDKMKRKHIDEGQREELDRLRQALEEREGDLSRLRTQERSFEDLEDKIHDLEVESREKERIINDHEDEAENMREEAEKQNDIIADLQDSLKQAQRRIVELEEEGSPLNELEEAKENIQELERLADRLRNDVEDAKADRQEAMREKERAESNLEELQDEMANKSITTKGLSRQIEEKANRLQDELEDLREKHADLEEQHVDQSRNMQKLHEEVKDLKRQHDFEVQAVQDQLETVQKEKDNITRAQESLSQQLHAAEQERQQVLEEKELLQLRHKSLTSESSSLQRDLASCRKDLKVLEDKLDHEKALGQSNETEAGNQYKEEIHRLNDENEDLRADVREKERLYDDDSDKWESERRRAESQLNMAEDRASALQRTVDRLQQTDGTLSTKETQLQQALQDEKSRHEDQEATLSRQIKELNDDIESKRKSLEVVRSELTSVKEELRLSIREQKSLSEKVEGLEDEVEILQTSLDDESDQANRELNASRQESEGLRKEIQSLRQEISRADSAAFDARSDVATFQDNIRAGQGSEEHLNSRIRDVETQLSKVRQEKQTLQDQLAAINLELFALRSSNTDVQAERDEIQSQLKAMRQQEDETFRLDQERIDLRATKMKLDNEIRRLRDENKAAITRLQTAENELEQEIVRASGEESRMSTEIQDLQKLIRNSSEKRELATAKKTIQQLEARIQQLEDRLSISDSHGDAAHELSLLRHELSAARQKETDFVQREAAQKDVLRGLKRQVTEMERNAHDAEISRFISPSPRSSLSGSARKSEIVEVRTQLATTHQTLKELRAQLKDAEKDANRKVNAANIELQARTTAWELEKDKLERSLDEADFKKEELQAKNAASEATVARLRGKIERLEKALQTERLNNGEDRTIVQERRDLHEMLRETQLQAESLELVIEERDKTIAAISAAESELRGQVKRIREERLTQKSKAASSQQQLASLEAKFKKARETWETERRGLCKGVRFVNQSLSVNEDSQAVVALRQEFHEKEHYHVKEMRGMAMQVEWLRARCKREEFFRFEAAFAKKYMALQIACFEACNRADIALLESSGIPRPVRKPKKKTFRVFLHIVRATVRMSRGVEAWKEKRKIGDRLSDKIREQRAESKLLLQQQYQQQRMITNGR